MGDFITPILQEHYMYPHSGSSQPPWEGEVCIGQERQHCAAVTNSPTILMAERKKHLFMPVDVG